MDVKVFISISWRFSIAASASNELFCFNYLHMLAKLKFLASICMFKQACSSSICVCPRNHLPWIFSTEMERFPRFLQLDLSLVLIDEHRPAVLAGLNYSETPLPSETQGFLRVF